MGWLSTSVQICLLLASLLNATPVDINTAGEALLESLPGIGPVKAAAILEYRDTYGPFACLDDLLEVPGIGPATLREIAPLLVVGSTDGAAADTLHWIPRVDSMERPLLAVAVLDIGEGDATLIRAAGGRSALVDGGPDDNGPLAPAVILRLSEQGMDSIDCILMTHPHEDHIGGLDDVIMRMDVDTLFDPGYAFPTPSYEELLEAVEQRGVGYSLLCPGQVITLSPSVSITVLACGSAGVDLSANEASAVFLVRCGSFSMLLPGDVEEGTERLLAGQIQPVTAMLVPHHGSRTSAFPPFLRHLRPEFAIVSAGRDNPFGHPHSAVLDAYGRLGATVLRTDTGGSIFLDTDGIRVSIHSSM